MTIEITIIVIKKNCNAYKNIRHSYKILPVNYDLIFLYLLYNLTIRSIHNNIMSYAMYSITNGHNNATKIAPNIVILSEQKNINIIATNGITFK